MWVAVTCLVKSTFGTQSSCTWYSDQTAKKKIVCTFVTMPNLLKSLEAAPALVPVLVQPVVGLPHLIANLFFWFFFSGIS